MQRLWNIFLFQLPHILYHSFTRTDFMFVSSPTAVYSSKQNPKKTELAEWTVSLIWMCSLGFQRLSLLSGHLHFSVCGHFLVPHVNETARRAQLNPTCYCPTRASVSHFPLQTKPWTIVFFKENKSLVLRWQRLNRFWFKVKFIMQFLFAVLQGCIVLLWICFGSIMWPRTGLMLTRSTARQSGWVSLLFSTNLSLIKLEKIDAWFSESQIVIHLCVSPRWIGCRIAVFGLPFVNS